MSDTCYSVECCDKDPLDTDSRTATDADDLTVGEPNPNCPEGYVWGGVGCVPEDSPQPCSTGYAWDGEECIEDDDDFECAEGYHLVGDDCVECDALATPTYVFENAGSVGVTCIVPNNATSLTVYILYDEVEVASQAGNPDPGAELVSLGPGDIFYEGHEYCFYFVVETTDCGTLTSPRVCVIFTAGLLP